MRLEAFRKGRSGRVGVTFLGLLLAFAGLFACSEAEAQASSSPTSGSPTVGAPTSPGVVVAPMVIDCGEPPTNPPPTCQAYKCTNGVWGLKWLATGAVCDDGNPCTYNTTCNVNHVCTGGSTVTCSAALCQACIGAAACVAAAAGTVCRAANPVANVCDKAETCNGSTMSCPADGAQGWATGACSNVPGLNTSCSCNGSGACANASSSTVTGVCWDDRGNMSGKYISPPAASCQVACPAP